MDRFFGVVLVAVALVGSGRADEGAVSEVEAWNQGVEFYRHGDVTNALKVLRPLVLSRTHGPRAAEIVAKLALERKDYEEAARMAQLALRANPQDERSQRNFTRAVDQLPAFREQQHLAQVMQGTQGKDPGALLLEATSKARQLMKTAGTFRTNAAPVAVAMADRLSASAERLADVYLPVREAVAQSVTNQEAAATILLQLDEAEKKNREAAKELSDLDGNAYSTMGEVEHALTRFLKMTIMPPAAIGEDLIAQSNAWQDAEMLNGRSWQGDALDYTRAFRAKFPAWARAYEQAAQSDTNKPPFTAEAQAKISALATELEKLQMECCEKSLPPSQERALKLLREIEALLPKDQNGGGQGQSGNPPPQDQPQSDQKQDQQSKQDQPKDQESQSDQRQDQDPNSSPEDQPQENPAAAEQSEEPQESPEDKAIEALLKKAQERNDEHEADKKARMRKATLPPNEKDW